LLTKILDENINLNRIKKKFTIDGWKCLKNKISKTKETAEWNCSVCKIDVHLYEINTSKRYEIYFVNIFTKMKLHKKLSS
jgi:hypothetical protein